MCVCVRERDENLDHCLLKVVFIRERERESYKQRRIK